MNRTGSGPVPDKSRKTIYKERYDAAKKGGEQFYPDTIARTRS